MAKGDCVRCTHCAVCKHRSSNEQPWVEEHCKLVARDERPRGEWIIRRDKQKAHIYSVCSKCNVPYLETDFPNFCPNCGSDNRPREGDKE